VVVLSVTAAVLVVTARNLNGGHHAVHPQAVVSADTGAVPAQADPGSATAADTLAGPALEAGTSAGVDDASADAVTAAVHDVDAIDDAATASDIGIAVLDRETGALTLGAAGAAPFYAASVVKLYTVVDILHRSETGETTVDDDDVALIKRALSLSDDQAMNALWEKFGGVETVSGTISLAGLKDSSPPTDPSQWGEALISARDVVTLYDYIDKSLAATDRDLVMDALTDAQDTGADGFDQAFGLLDPPRPDGVAAKQGWMWIGSEFYMHTTGLLDDDRYAVAMLTRNPASSAPARALVDKAAAAVEDQLDS
jgi:NACalpha-BTF3-like transcription factor